MFLVRNVSPALVVFGFPVSTFPLEALPQIKKQLPLMAKFLRSTEDQVLDARTSTRQGLLSGADFPSQLTHPLEHAVQDRKSVV